MHKAILVTALVAPLALAGCKSMFGETPQQQVYAAKSAYHEAVKLALIYESLPRCAAGQTFADNKCSDAKVVDTIRKADDVAAATIDGAEKTVRDPAASDSNLSLAVVAAQNTVAAFTSIIATLGVK